MASENTNKYEENLKKLWNMIVKAEPEQKEKIIAHLDKKTINDLRTFKNPYKKPIIQGSKIRLLAFNVINMTEKYAQRFAMTSLIGFIYRMLDEYDPDSEYVSENDPKFANPYNAKVKEFVKQQPFNFFNQNLDNLEKQLESSTDDKTQRKILKDIFKNKTKIVKHRIYLLKDDYKNLKDKRDDLDKDIKALQASIKNHVDHVDELEIKLEKKKKYDADMLQRNKNMAQDSKSDTQNTNTTENVQTDEQTKAIDIKCDEQSEKQKAPQNNVDDNKKNKENKPKSKHVKNNPRTILNINEALSMNVYEIEKLIVKTTDLINKMLFDLNLLQ